MLQNLIYIKTNKWVNIKLFSHYLFKQKRIFESLSVKNVFFLGWQPYHINMSDYTQKITSNGKF